MDVLSGLLMGLKIRSTTVSRWTLHRGYGVDVCQFSPGYFLTVTAGEPMQFRFNNAIYTLCVGDSLIALRGADCLIGDESVTQFENISDLDWQGVHNHYDIEQQYSSIVKVDVGIGTKHSEIIGIAFEFESDTLTHELPEVISLPKGEHSTSNLLQQSTDFLAKEEQPGYFALALQIAEFTVTSSIRQYILSNEAYAPGVLKGLKDPQLRYALKAIHHSSEQQWTLESLAQLSAMSRSAFAAKFSETVGVPPINYLTKVRIQKAQHLLLSTEFPIAMIADKVGFHSDRVFRSAFKKWLGLSPMSYRKL